jgi:hypothetical protein
MQRRSAFAAITMQEGAIVVRVLADTSGVCPQQEYACFETWTQAQVFASMLKEKYGIDPVEARHIVVSASLAAESSKQKIIAMRLPTLPTSLFAQFRDVRGVMPAVPGI